MEELSNDEEYNDIMEDMQEECAKVWTVSNSKVLLKFLSTCLQMSNGKAFDSEALYACLRPLPTSCAVSVSSANLSLSVSYFAST